MSPRDRLLAVLQRHIGAENGATMAEICAEINAPDDLFDCDLPPLTERQVRSLVEALRLEGVHICAHPKRGYFIAGNDVELEETCEFLRHRALTSLAQIAAIRNCSLPDLLGQLRFTA